MHCVLLWKQTSLPGDKHEPADDQADEHGDANRHANEVANADQRHGKAGRDGGCATREAEAARRFAGHDLGLRKDRVGG